MTDENPIDCDSCVLFPSCTRPLKRDRRLCRDFTGPCDACKGPMGMRSRRFDTDQRLLEGDYECLDPNCGATYRIRVVGPEDENWGP